MFLFFKILIMTYNLRWREYVASLVMMNRWKIKICIHVKYVYAKLV